MHKQIFNVDESRKLAERVGLPWESDLSGFDFIQEKMQLFPYSFVKKRIAIPLKEEQGILYVAIADPFDLETIEEIRYTTGSVVQEIVASRAAIEAAIESCYRHDDQVTSEYIQELGVDENKAPEIIRENEYDLFDESGDSAVVKLLNMILIEALQQEASDIHLEPGEQGVMVRYRVDGVLQLRHTLPKDVQNQLMTRLKVLAELDIAEHRLPQDGRIKLRMAGREIDFRVSTVPVVYGERIVLRILDRSNVVLGLEQIGMSEKLLHNIRTLLHHNQGIILVTGPTGSGKTTTLYSALSEICSNEINIMTIEDPVEFKLQGMAQISVNPKINLHFSTGLRHILRQDPDVIMIGEIRDRETAEIAIQASLTGHLVFSTLHTNDAPAAITRLVDMGIEPYLLSSSLLAVVAQRLVRRLCPHCKSAYIPSKEEVRELDLKPAEVTGPFYQAKGCNECFSSGYRGRLGIYEMMAVTAQVKQQILKSADSAKLQKVAIDQGMSHLRREGALLVLKGMTTSAEVLRVSRQLDEEIS